MLRMTASLADGIPVDLRDALTSLDDTSIRLLHAAIRRASGRRPQQEPVSSPACRIGFQLPGEETTK
jgi:hypothetical protein